MSEMVHVSGISIPLHEEADYDLGAFDFPAAPRVGELLFITMPSPDDRAAMVQVGRVYYRALVGRVGVGGMWLDAYPATSVDEQHLEAMFPPHEEESA